MDDMLQPLVRHGRLDSSCRRPERGKQHASKKGLNAMSIPDP